MAKANKKRKQSAPPRQRVQHGNHAGTSTANGHKKLTKSSPQKQQHQQHIEPTIPFEPDHRILLVGEGDFSFARSLVEHHNCFDVTATSYDSQTEVHAKYSPQVQEHIQYLEDAGQTVLHGVDATKLDKNKSLTKTNGGGGAKMGFDRILFNFPHVGGKSTDVNRQVRFNQELLVKFFGAAGALLATSPSSALEREGGAIVVTLFEGEPYTLWNIRDLARHSGLQVSRSFRFVSTAYPGYRHARTLGNLDGEGPWRGEDREARSYVFTRKEEEGPRTNQVRSTKNKRKRDADSDEEV